MRRRLLTTAVFLLAGALVNAAVAWASATWGAFGFKETSAGYTISDSGAGWVLTRHEWIDATRLISRRDPAGTWYGPWIEAESSATAPISRLTIAAPSGAAPAEAFLAPWGRIRASSALCGPGEYQQLIDDARGWPLRSMWCGWGTLESCSRPFPTDEPLAHGIPLQSRNVWPLSPMPWKRALPLAIWPLGFAVNTLFYAAILWLLICSPFLLRRFIRSSRGLCPACAYPMSDSPICTECGKELPKPAVA